jgi:hypothetical protein
LEKIKWQFKTINHIGGYTMDANKSIACTVDECKFHAKKESYCSLDQIKVVKHVDEAKSKEATDCGSFEYMR